MRKLKRGSFPSSSLYKCPGDPPDQNFVSSVAVQVNPYLWSALTFPFGIVRRCYLSVWTLTLNCVKKESVFLTQRQVFMGPREAK